MKTVRLAFSRHTPFNSHFAGKPGVAGFPHWVSL